LGEYNTDEFMRLVEGIDNKRAGIEGFEEAIAGEQGDEFYESVMDEFWRLKGIYGEGIERE
jgi:hypothetical protein